MNRRLLARVVIIAFTLNALWLANFARADQKSVLRDLLMRAGEVIR